jgi:hypothetical protein
MIAIYLIPLAFQGLVMAVDEFYCHYRRGLPKWERIGHPLDTLSVLICIGICVFFMPTIQNLHYFIAAALFSCLFITKDEFIHNNVCDGFEQWLHALLMVLHPLVLIATGLLWFQNAVPFLKFEFFIFIVFFLYQIIFWGICAKKITH